MPKFFFQVLAFLFIFTSSQKILAQEESPVKSDFKSIKDSIKLFWITGGAGIISPLLGADLRATYSWGFNNMSVETGIAAGFDDGPITEYGIYYGRQQFTEESLGRAAIGISYFNGYYQGRVNMLGICGELEVLLKERVVGIGLMGKIMVMPKHLFVGIFLNLSFGKLY